VNGGRYLVTDGTPDPVTGGTWTGSGEGSPGCRESPGPSRVWPGALVRPAGTAAAPETPGGN